MGFDMAYEVTPLQGGVILKRSRMTERVPRAFLSECAVGLEDQAHGFVEVGSGFVERRPLGVGAWKLLHEGDVAFRHLLEHGG